MREIINFTPEKARRFRQAYEQAKADGAGQFVFEGHDFLVVYARYLLEYLESRGMK